MKHIFILIPILSFGILQACVGDGNSSSNSDTDTDTNADTNGDSDTGPAGFSPCPTDGSDCKIMPVGDSITYGEGSSDGGAYRTHLFRKCLTDNKKITFVGRAADGPNTIDGVSFPKNHEGYSGISVDEFIAQQVTGALNANIPHIFLVHLGTNDITWKGAEGVSDEMSSLIDILTEKAPDALVAVAQLVPISYNPPELTGYNNDIPGIVANKVSEGKHVIAVDLHSDFPSDGLGGDGVHPNDKGYEFMGNTWYEALQEYLP